MTYACISRQKGKFSSNLLLSAHLTYVPTHAWKRQELEGIDISYIYYLVSVLPFRFQFINSGYLQKHIPIILEKKWWQHSID